MKRILLLIVMATTIFSGCNGEPKVDLEQPPVVPPVTVPEDYIDYANWKNMFFKDVATAEPMIKGTKVFDTILYKDQRIIVYHSNTPAGIVVTKYGFDHRGELRMIRSRFKNIDTMSIESIFRHSKVMSMDINSMVESYGSLGSMEAFTFEIYNGEGTVRQISHNRVSNKKEYHTRLWKYIDKQVQNGFEAQDTVSCSEMWFIKDDFQRPDVATKEIAVNLGFAVVGDENFLESEFLNFEAPSDEDAEILRFLEYYFYYGNWDYPVTM